MAKMVKISYKAFTSYKISALLILVTSVGLTFVCVDKIRSPGNRAMVFCTIRFICNVILQYSSVNKFKFYCGSNFPEYV